MAYNIVYQSQAVPTWYDDMMRQLAARAEAQYNRRQQEEAAGRYLYPEARQAQITPFTREIFLQMQRRENLERGRPAEFQLGTRYGSPALDKLHDLAAGLANVSFDLSRRGNNFPNPEEFKRFFKQRTGMDFPSDTPVPTSLKELDELNRRTGQSYASDPITKAMSQMSDYNRVNQISLPEYEKGIQSRLLNASSPLRPDELQGAPVREYQQSVEDALRDQSRRNYEEFVKPQLTEQFVRAGQYGSRRHGDLAQKALASQTRDLDQRIAHLKYTNYLDRLNSARENRRLGLQAAMGAQQQVGSLRDQEQKRQQEMLAAGEMQRALEQQRQDIAYQDWLREKQSPEQNLATLSSQIAGITPGTSYMQRVEQTPPAQQMNLAGNIGSIAGQLLGGRRAGIFRHGGLVRRYY